MTTKKPRLSRRAAIRAFTKEQRELTPEQRELDRRWLERRKANLLLDHAEAVHRVEQRYERLRADLEATKAATEELKALRAIGDATLH
jgi:hypothetical protein